LQKEKRLQSTAVHEFNINTTTYPKKVTINHWECCQHKEVGQEEVTDLGSWPQTDPDVRLSCPGVAGHLSHMANDR